MKRLRTLSLLALAACSGSGGGSDGFANLPADDPRTPVLRGLRTEDFVGTAVDRFLYPIGDSLRAVVTSASITGVEWTAQQLDNAGAPLTTWQIRSVTEPAFNASQTSVQFEVEVVDADSHQTFRCPARVRAGEISWGPTPAAEGYCIRQPSMHRARWVGTYQGTIPEWDLGRARMHASERNRAYRVQVDDSDGLTASGTLTISVDDGHGTPWRPVRIPFGAAVSIGGALIVQVPTSTGPTNVSISIDFPNGPVLGETWLFWGSQIDGVRLHRV